MPSVLAVPCLAILPFVLRAQTIPPACRPVIEAEKKQIMTPHYTYLTEGQAKAGSKATTHEVISTSDATYIMVRGAWRRSPMGPRDALDLFQKNLSTAKVLSCQHAGDDVVGGVSAAVYIAHTENEDVKADTRTWIAKGTGLILRQEEDLDLGDPGDRRHMSMRYDYANVRAPAGVP
jgi:hypothetical protein